MAGDYDRFSRYMEQGARIFYEQLDIPAGCQLLDVACGSGQVALWAARDGVNVTGVDIAPNLVQRAQARAKAEGLTARFIEGDAEALPFEEDSFDVVSILVGAMFAPRPELVARELLRVQSRGHHRHGKLDAPRVCGANVPNLRQVHRSFGHAGSGVVG
jgi:ubiquinone/menaquinone biosynthesis C-methylase UbiE